MPVDGRVVGKNLKMIVKVLELWRRNALSVCSCLGIVIGGIMHVNFIDLL